MATIDAPVTTDRNTTPAVQLFTTGALAGIAGGIAALVVALVALALGVSLEVSQPGGGLGPTPLPAFVIATFVPSLVGAGIAVAFQRWATRPARTFTVTMAVLVVLSFGQPLLMAQDPASALALVVAHVAAAAVVVPALARRLPYRR